MPPRFRSSLKKAIGDKDFVNRKLAPNHIGQRKYGGIKSKLKTGSNSGNVRPKLDTRGEIFKRINRNTLAKFIKAAESQEESVYDFRAGDAVSEYSVTTSVDASIDVANTNYLLLDVRDVQDFQTARIIGAMSFPMALLRRDAFTRELYEFKNKPNHVIVLYHIDECKTGKEAAQLFFEKGFTNARLLTGGLRDFNDKFPHRVTGDVPPPTPSRMSMTGRGSRLGDTSRRTSVRGSTRGSTYGGSYGGTGRVSPREQLARAQGVSRSGSVFRDTGKQTFSTRSSRTHRSDAASKASNASYMRDTRALQTGAWR